MAVDLTLPFPLCVCLLERRWRDWPLETSGLESRNRYILNRNGQYEYISRSDATGKRLDPIFHLLDSMAPSYPSFRVPPLEVPWTIGTHIPVNM